MTYDEQDKQRVFGQLEIIGKVIEREESSFLNLGSVSIALIVILTLGKDLVVFSEKEGKVLFSVGEASGETDKKQGSCECYKNRQAGKRE